MSKEASKKLDPDELYFIIINALFRTIKQISTIYSMGIDDIVDNILQLEHGC